MNPEKATVIDPVVEVVELVIPCVVQGVLLTVRQKDHVVLVEVRHRKVCYTHDIERNARVGQLVFKPTPF
jgi:hypothetical protein